MRLRKVNNMLFPIKHEDLYKCRFTSRFGFQQWRNDGKGKIHRGIDIAAPIGTPIQAPFNGIVKWCKTNHGGSSKGAGHYLVIQKENSQDHVMFAHLQRVPALKKGQKIKVGQTIAHTGNTGYTTGPHLHFEVHRKGFKFEYQAQNSGHDTAINPLIVFPQLDKYENKYLKGISFKNDEKTELKTIKMLLHGNEVEAEGYNINDKNYIHVRFLEKLGYQVTNKGSMPVIEYK